jgi:hypothetical protein
MLSKIIKNFVAKMVAGRADDGIMITLKDPKKVEFQGRMLEDLLMRNGIDPNAIKSEEQLKNILNQIRAIETQAIRNTDVSGIRGTTSAKVFDLEGKEIPKGSKIMGGKAVDDDLPPPGSRGGDDDIAAPVQSAEESLRDMTEAEIKANIEKGNKDSVKRILERKNREDVYGLEDYDTTNMSEIKKEIIRTETKLGNLNPNTPGFRERAKPLIDKITALQKKLKAKKERTTTQEQFNKDVEEAGGMEEFLNKNPIDDDSGDFAKGGMARIGLKVGTGKKFLQKVFGKEKFEEMATRDPEMYVGLLEVVDMYRKRDKEGLKMYLQKFLPHMDDTQIEEFIRGSDGSEGLIGELIRLGSGRDYAGKIEMMKRADEMRKLDNLEVTDDMIRKPNADGGIMRLGFKDGMNRRTFLKFLAGAASIPIVGKILKPFKIGKTVTKVPIIKTDNVPGKPEWFDQLVNKVILEGEDVTKKLATGERQSIHQKTLKDGSVVRVTEDVDDGAVRVEYESEKNVFGDPVQMQYRKELADEGNPKPTAEFTTAESGPVGRVVGPDDVELDVDEVGGMSIKDLDSDVSILKEYATGQKPTMKELVQNIKRQKKASDITDDIDGAASDAVVRRQGDYDPSDYDDFASGGIARMLGE